MVETKVFWYCSSLCKCLVTNQGWTQSVSLCNLGCWWENNVFVAVSAWLFGISGKVLSITYRALTLFDSIGAVSSHASFFVKLDAFLEFCRGSILARLHRDINTHAVLAWIVTGGWCVTMKHHAVPEYKVTGFRTNLTVQACACTLI